MMVTGMIENDKRVLGELLLNPIKGESSSSFRVPRFQRKYEWEKEEQVLRLVTDVFDNLGQTNFMGPMIFCQEDPHSKQIEIIDGQQRLVTFAIFYRAAADYIRKRKNEGAFEAESDPNVNELENQLKSKIAKGFFKKHESVIQISKAINPFFREQIILNEDIGKVDVLRKGTKGEHPSEKKLREAYVKIYDLISERYNQHSGNQLLNKLGELVEALIFRQIFLSITVLDYANAFTIFETMNERGKRLTLSDLIKNLCFRKMQELGDDLLDEYEVDWDNVEKDLVSNFGLFLWHVWVSRFGTCPRRRVFTEIQEHVKNMNSNDVWDFSSAMIFDEAVWYHDYENPIHDFDSIDKGNKERNRYLRLLKSMGASRCYPLLLGIDYAEKKAKTISVEQANSLLKTLTCLTFWHSGVCEKDAKELEKIYHELAQELRKFKLGETEGKLKSISDKLIAKFPSSAECQSSFITRTFTDEGFVKMTLREIELVEAPGEKILASDKVVWLEHVLPKNPKKDSSWVKVFDNENVRKEYTHKIGNQTLLLDRKNRDEARNYDFGKKKTIYLKSQVLLTQNIVKEKQWNAKTIDVRSDSLFHSAQKVWPIFSN